VEKMMPKESEATFEMKCKAVNAVISGQTIESVSKTLQFNRSTIHRWLQKYRSTEDLNSLRHEQRPGRPRKMKGRVWWRIRLALQKPATKYGFETNFWNSTRIIQFAKKEIKVKLSQPTVWRWLRQSGLTYQKPEKRYMQENAKLKAEWLRTEVPRILRAVEKYKAILYFEDESTIQLAPVLGKTWSPRGERDDSALINSA